MTNLEKNELKEITGERIIGHFWDGMFHFQPTKIASPKKKLLKKIKN